MIEVWVIEILNVLENGSDFVPIQRKINNPELKQELFEFCRDMCN